MTSMAIQPYRPSQRSLIRSESQPSIPEFLKPLLKVIGEVMGDPRRLEQLISSFRLASLTLEQDSPQPKNPLCRCRCGRLFNAVAVCAPWRSMPDTSSIYPYDTTPQEGSDPLPRSDDLDDLPPPLEDVPPPLTKPHNATRDYLPILPEPSLHPEPSFPPSHRLPFPEYRSFILPAGYSPFLTEQMFR